MQALTNPEKALSKPKHPGGRPIKYTPKVIARITNNLTNFMRECDEKKIFPTRARFILRYNLTRDQLIRFTDVNSPTYSEKFSDAMRHLEAMQEANLVENALNGNYQSSFSIFTAKNVLGWKDEHHIKADIRQAVVFACDEKAMKEIQGDKPFDLPGSPNKIAA